MKKKLMMVAVLLGALSLGACVDDNESQSVTDLRGAKAKQLEALANLYNAQAAAEEITSQAEAKYKEAQARYKEALAAEKEFETQKAKEQYERDLEAINLEAQNRLLEAQIQAKKNEQEFLALANDLLKDLYNQYAAEVSELDNLKSQLNQQKLWLAQYEAQAIATDDYNAQQEAYYNQEIARLEAHIKAYKAYEGLDKADLQSQLWTLQLQNSNAYQTYLQKMTLTNTAQTAYNEAKDAFYYYNDAATLKTVLAVETLYDNDIYVINQEDIVIDEENYLSVPYYTLAGEASVVSWRQDLTNNLKSKKDYLGAPKAGETAATGLYVDLENAQVQLKAAEEAKDQNQIDTWTYQIASINDQIAAAKENVTEAQEKLDAFETAIASFSGDDLKAYDAAIEAFKTSDVVTALQAAIEEEGAAWGSFFDINAEWSVVNDLYNNSIDVDQEIALLNTNIASYKQNIANLSNSYEQSVQQAKDEITRLETQIEMQQAVVDLAKENLDNAIATQGGEEPAA